MQNTVMQEQPVEDIKELMQYEVFSMTLLIAKGILLVMMDEQQK